MPLLVVSESSYIFASFPHFTSVSSSFLPNLGRHLRYLLLQWIFFIESKLWRKYRQLGASLDPTVVNIRCVAIVIWHVCLTVAWSSWGTPGDRGGVIRTHLSKVTCGSGEGVHRNCRGRDLVLDTGHMCIKDLLSLAGDTCEEKPGMQFSQVDWGSWIRSGRGEGGGGDKLRSMACPPILLRIKFITLYYCMQWWYGFL